MILSSIHELMSYIIFRSNHYIKAHNFVMEQASKQRKSTETTTKIILRVPLNTDQQSEDDGYLNEWQ